MEDGRWKMESEEYMKNRQQQEAENIEVSILIITNTISNLVHIDDPHLPSTSKFPISLLSEMSYLPLGGHSPINPFRTMER